MEITIERTNIERDYKYTSDKEYQQFIIMEPDSPDYASTVILLRNLAEKRDITSLERQALAAAIQLLRNNIETKEL